MHYQADLHLAYKLWCQHYPKERVTFQEWFQTKDPDNRSGWVPPAVRPTFPSVYAAAGRAEYTTTRPYGNRRAADWSQNDGWWQAKSFWGAEWMRCLVIPLLERAGVQGFEKVGSTIWTVLGQDLEGQSPNTAPQPAFESPTQAAGQRMEFL